MFERIYTEALKVQDEAELKLILGDFFLDTVEDTPPFLTVAGKLAANDKAETADLLGKLGANPYFILYGYVLAANHDKVEEYRLQYAIDVDFIASSYAYVGDYAKVEEYKTKLGARVDLIAHQKILTKSHKTTELHQEKIDRAVALYKEGKPQRFIHAHLNMTQMKLIEGAFNYLLGQFLGDPASLVCELQDAIAENQTEMFKQLLSLFHTNNLSIKLHELLMHPCPQNSCDGDAAIVQPVNRNKVAYLDFKGNRIVEPKGLLNLTPHNDETALPVNKEAVIAYIHFLVHSKIALKQLEIHKIAEFRFAKFLDLEFKSLHLDESIQRLDRYYAASFLQNHTDLKHLSLKLGFEAAEVVLREIFPMKHLESLMIQGLYAGNIAIISNVISKLRFLRLKGFHLELNDYTKIAEQIADNNQLTSLILDFWPDSVESQVPLFAEALCNKSNLTCLSLSGNYGDGAAINFVNGIIKNKLDLTSLTIHGNLIGDKGAIAISYAIKLQPNLNSLSLHGYKIDSMGVQVLAEAVATNKKIISFSLCSNEIYVKSAVELVKFLENHPSLTSLTLNSEKIDHERVGDEVALSGVKAMVCRFGVRSITEKKHLSLEAKKILAEANPLKQANFAVEPGLTVRVPSLQQLSFFKVQQLKDNPETQFKNQREQDKFTAGLKMLTEELKEKLQQFSAFP